MTRRGKSLIWSLILVPAFLYLAICAFMFSHLTKLKPAKRIYFPGNDRHGIWSSPLHETIYSPEPSFTASLDIPPPPETTQR